MYIYINIDIDIDIKSDAFDYRIWLREILVSILDRV